MDWLTWKINSSVSDKFSWKWYFFTHVEICVTWAEVHAETLGSRNKNKSTVWRHLRKSDTRSRVEWTIGPREMTHLVKRRSPSREPWGTPVERCERFLAITQWNICYFTQICSFSMNFCLFSLSTTIAQKSDTVNTCLKNVLKNKTKQNHVQPNRLVPQYYFCPFANDLWFCENASDGGSLL